MRVTIRDRVRTELGLDQLSTDERVNTFEIRIRDMLNALELREKQRHEALMGMLNRVEQRLINAHAFDKPTYAPATLDWETVQAIAMQQLQENPSKEI
jgi:hypothetical protein